MAVNGKKYAENESTVTKREKIIVLGSGPNRIGQGIEFDYSCVHGVLAAKEAGYEAIMINCNPETVSTDFDTADKLYFEPVFWEHIYDIILHEKPLGVIVQLGGQTALKLAEKLERYGIKIMGTSYHALDIAEDRGRFSQLLAENIFIKVLLRNCRPSIGNFQKVKFSILVSIICIRGAGNEDSN